MCGECCAKAGSPFCFEDDQARGGFPYRGTVRSTLIWGLIGAASLAEGCVLIDYGQRTSSIEDGGRVEPLDEDGGGADGSAAPDASPDARSDAAVKDDAAQDAAHDTAQDAARDAAQDSAQDASQEDTGVDADAAADDTSTDGSTDAMMACTAPNECGGCAPLAKSAGSVCGACGVGRYICDGTEALACANDGSPASPGNPVLIDDLEDGDENILTSYGLSGEWYMVSDSTGGTLNPPSSAVPVPTNVGALGSGRSMHFTASGFTRWGAGMAVSLNAYGCGYDASKQTGVEFHIRGSGSVLVQVGTVQTVPMADNGTCTANCNDLFGTTITATSNWALRKAVFANLAQAGWGTPATFDPSKLLYVQFTVQPGSSLDLYIDNLSFY
jgi:hypothetical protein